jgi:hypothetical protein
MSDRQTAAEVLGYGDDVGHGVLVLEPKQLDQPRYDERTGHGFDHAGVGDGEPRRDRRDFALRDADVDHLLRVAGKPRAGEEKVEAHAAPYSAASSPPR